MILMLLVCILLFISCLGAGGKVGSAVGSFLFGLFGVSAYIFPFLLFYLYVFILVNIGRKGVVSRSVTLSILYIFICALLQFILYGYQTDVTLGDLYLESAAGHSGGGLLGGMLVQLFGSLFGRVGACLIIIVGIVVCAMLLTQKSILQFVRKKGSEVYDTRDDRIIAREERRRDRLQKRDASRAEREREHRIREQQRRRTEMARRQSAAARRVDPQTISNTGSSAIRTRRSVNPISADISAQNMANASQEHVFSTADIPDDIIDNGRQTSVRKKSAGKTGNTENTENTVEKAAAAKTAVSSSVKNAPAEKSSKKNDDYDFSDEVFGGGPIEDASAGKVFSDKKKSAASPASAASIKQKSDAESNELTVTEPPKPPKPFVPPSTDLLDPPSGDQTGESNEHLKAMGVKLQQTLETFGVNVKINHISCGPSVTRFELTPQMGVKVSKIMSLRDDIELSLAAQDVRIEAPIPGKSAVGIEVPNKKVTTVNLRELLETPEFRNHKSDLAFVVGKNIAGQPVVADLAKMPHLLIAGATGSGKSVFINTMIMSLIYKSKPDDVKFIMIDPKVVELSVYNGIPEMLIPVVTDPKKAAGALNWAVTEMTNRYQKFASVGARDIKSYNAKIRGRKTDDGQPEKKMFRIVIIVDELADLMMAAKDEVEESICRLAQLARAAGIHLVIATQRPSVDVITGLIKANMPSRVALSVTSGVDSRTILDMNGAEKLLGNGDMLFYPQGYQKPARIQGAFLSDDEIGRVADYLRSQNSDDSQGSTTIQKEIDSHTVSASVSGADPAGQDEYFADAGRLIIEKDKASIGMLQRAFRIGFNRAARIMDQLCDAGVVGEEEGTKPRRILMTMEQFENYLEESS